VFSYQPAFNPRRKRTPTPRPDYVVRRKGRVVAIADAKYRDLWERDLPRDMLYQLSVYALSHEECRTATILYPTSASSLALESRISINDSVIGRARAQVCMRPVLLPMLADLVTQPRTAINDRRRRDYARYLVYGMAPAA
jgi:5-methylcytosine-specific restriction enzyme subunit McrC